MIDLLTVQIGDTVEYGPYQCSKNLEHERFTGTYQGFDFWSPDERPAEIWLDLLSLHEPSKGLAIRVRASQVTQVWHSQASQKQQEEKQNNGEELI